MFSLFSLSSSMGASGPKPIDLELLSDAELLAVWDQTQNFINSLEDKNLPTHISLYYSFIIEAEMQSRALIEPTSFFQLVKDDEDNSKDKNILFPTQILTKNIIV